MCIARFINKEDDKPISKYLSNYENNFRESNSYMKRDEGQCVGTGTLYFNYPNIQTSFECELRCKKNKDC